LIYYHEATGITSSDSHSNKKPKHSKKKKNREMLLAILAVFDATKHKILKHNTAQYKIPHEPNLSLSCGAL
jgi:hypothetical protein